jgi:S1-C subfamily serine protease
MPRLSRNSSHIFRAIALLFLCLSLIPLGAAGIAYAQSSRIDTTIMLEKAKAGVALIVIQITAYIIWGDFASYLQRVGLPPIVQVEEGGTCTGYIVTPDGYVMTAGHCVNNFESELKRYIHLLEDFVNKYAQAYTKTTGRSLSNDQLSSLFDAVVSAYLTNKLKIQEYKLQVYVGLGKVVSGIGNIGKLYQARVIDSSPGEREDLALLKIDVINAPSFIVAKEDIGPGERVWAIGYPGVIQRFFSQESLYEPTITEGTVSGYREQPNGIRFLQSDVYVYHGNSGGPLVNSRGEVVASVSYGVNDPRNPRQQLPGYNFFTPSSLINEMLRKNNVMNSESESMKLYGEGIDLYYGKHYSASIEKFQLVKNLYPGFPFVDDYIAKAQASILRGEDVPLSSFPWLPGYFPLVVGAVVAAAAIGGGLGYFVILRTRRTARGGGSPASSKSRYEEVKGEDQHAIDQNAPETPKSSGDITSVDVERPPKGYKYCINCGKLIPLENDRCPYCGVEQR